MVMASTPTNSLHLGGCATIDGRKSIIQRCQISVLVNRLREVVVALDEAGALCWEMTGEPGACTAVLEVAVTAGGMTGTESSATNDGYEPR